MYKFHNHNNVLSVLGSALTVFPLNTEVTSEVTLSLIPPLLSAPVSPAVQGRLDGYGQCALISMQSPLSVRSSFFNF